MSKRKYHPSVELRFIERDGKRILQQGWFPDGGGYIEWRDVPLVEELRPAVGKDVTRG